MRIDIDGILICDFKSFRHQYVDLARVGPGLHFLRGRNDSEPRLGPNGAGKSTIWGALCWVLFGKTQEGLRNPDVISWAGGRPEVQVVLRIDGHKHVISRVASTPVRLQIDDRDRPQEYLEELIGGLTYEVFTSAILLGQGRPLFFDLSPADKMDRFSETLNLDRWEARSKFAGERASKLSEEAHSITVEVAQTRNTVAFLNDRTIELKAKADQWQAQYTKEHAAAEANINELGLNLAGLLSRHHLVDRDYEQASINYRQQVEAVRQLNDYLRIEQVAMMVAKNRIADGHERLKTLKADLDLIDKAKKCPTCGQALKNSVDIENHRAEIRAKIAELKDVVSDGAYKAAEKTVADLKSQLQEAEAEGTKFRKLSDEAEAQLRLLAEEKSKLEGQITAYRKLKQQSSEARNPYLEQVKATRDERNAKERAIEELESQHGKLLRQIERTKYWVKGFKDIRLQIIEEVLQELEITTTAMLAQMGLIDWQVSYAIEKETKSGTVKRGLTATILSPANDKPVRWENWSGGEGQRLRLVSALALSDVLLNHAGVEPGIEVLDEPTQHLSSEGVGDLCEFLGERAATLGRQVWLVDHKAVESGAFASTLTVVKDGGGSRLETGGNRGEGENGGKIARKRGPENGRHAWRRHLPGSDPIPHRAGPK